MNARLSMGNVHLRCVQAENHKAKHAIRFTKKQCRNRWQSTKKQNKNKNLREKILHLDANRKTAAVAVQIDHTYPGRGSRSILKTPTSSLCVTRTGQEQPMSPSLSAEFVCTTILILVLQYCTVPYMCCTVLYVTMYSTYQRSITYSTVRTFRVMIRLI